MLICLGKNKLENRNLCHQNKFLDLYIMEENIFAEELKLSIQI